MEEYITVHGDTWLLWPETENDLERRRRIINYHKAEYEAVKASIKPGMTREEIASVAWDHKPWGIWPIEWMRIFI